MNSDKNTNESIFDFTDAPSYSDELNITSHIDGISKFIINCATPMTISIQGEWGTGKSSIMKQVMKKIENQKEGKFLNIWFDTWMFSQFTFDKQLPIILLNRLVSEIIEQDKGTDTPTKQSERFLNSLRRITNVVADATNDAVKHRWGVDFIKSFATEAQMSDEETEHQDIYKEIEEIRNQFKRLTADSKYERFVIYIDDLDRLVPDKAVELLEVLKIFLDVYKCVFVLAIDYDVVLRGVSKKYGFDLKDRKEYEKGKNFFDKIIQVPYSVPLKDYDFKDFINNFIKSPELTNLVDSEIDSNEFEKLLMTSVGKNPRTIKRILNSFHLTTLTESKDKLNNPKGNENLTLLALLCMQNAYPHIYSYCMKNSLNHNTLKELLNPHKMERNSIGVELLEEINKDGNMQFLKQVIDIIKVVDDESLERIFSNSSNTFVIEQKSSSRLIQLSTLEELIAYNSKHYQRNITYNIESLQRLENEIYSLSDQLTKRYLINQGTTVIQFKTGISNIAEIKLNINSFSVECVLGKNLEDNETVRNIVDKHNLRITNANKVTFKDADLDILNNPDILEDLLKIIELRIKSK